PSPRPPATSTLFPYTTLFRSSIMTKSFFVVVPYSNTALRKDTGSFKGLFGRKSAAEAKLAGEADFEEKRSQLEERVSVIQQGLRSEEHTSELQSQSNLVCRLL